MTQALDAILRNKLVAVLRLERYDWSREIVAALLAGGVSVIEFTLTGRGACDAIATVRSEFDDRVQVGIGTVLDADAARASIDAGAQFVATPVIRPSVIDICRAAGTPVLCGALTPTEVLAAHERGANIIKIFPAHIGGPQYMKDLLGPLPHLRLLATAGITPENAPAYLTAGAVAVGMGSSLAPLQAISSRDWTAITERAKICAEACRPRTRDHGSM